METTTASTFASYRPSIQSRVRGLIERAKYWLQQALLRAAIRLTDESSLERHAKREMQAVGYKLDDQEDGPNRWIQRNLLELLAVFSMQGHSGSSAPYCIDMFQKLAKYEPLVPLTGKPEEWNEIGPGVFQNNRCGHVFKSKERFDGQPYDMDAVIFWDWYERALEPDEEGYPGTIREKSHFTCKDSARVISFPYTPKREYQERPAGWKQQPERLQHPGDGHEHGRHPGGIDRPGRVRCLRPRQAGPSGRRCPVRHHENLHLHPRRPD